MRSAVVVAGGSSERFGDREKALACVAGDPMISRVVRAAAPEVGEVVVNCRPDQRAEFAGALPSGTRFALDRPDECDAGPVTGLARGLAVATGDRTIALACDLPLLEAEVVSGLFERFEAHDCEAVVPVLESYRQPLCAVYDTRRARRACEAARRAGERRLLEAVAGLDAVEIGERADSGRLRAVDTPAELERVRGRAGARSSPPGDGGVSTAAERGR